MAPRKSPVPAARSAVKRARTNDSFVNAAARLGVGRNQDNLLSQGTYEFDPITRNRVLLESMYRSSWVIRRVVGVVAEDMTKAGVEFRGEADPADFKALKSKMTRTASWRMLTQGLKWGRLYGGAASMFQIKGQDPATPLRPETVGPKGFLGLRPYDRWQLTPIAGEVVQTPGPEQGQPVYYQVNPYGGNQASPEAAFRLHHTRLIRHEGDDLPVWQRQTEQGWGMSVVEPLYDRLLAYDSTTMGTAQLVFRAHLRTLYLDGWKQNLAMGGPQMDGALAEVDFVRRFQMLEGMTILDSKSRLEAQQYSFGGLDQVLTQMGSQIAGAAGIPQVKIFGQAPGGFSSGESDLQSYNDDIDSRREHDLRDGLSRLFQVLYWSELGRAPADDFDFEFSPLSVMSDDEKAGLAQSRGATVLSAFTAQAIDRVQVLKELQAIGADTGVFSSITDEDVQAAEQERDAAKAAAQQTALLGGTPGDPLGAPSGLEGGDGLDAGAGGPDDLPEGFSDAPDASGGGAAPDDLPEGFEGDDEDLPQGFRDAAPRSPDDITVEQLRQIFGDEVLRDAGIKFTKDAWEEGKHPRGNSNNKGQFTSAPGGGGAKPKKDSVGAQKLKALGVGHDHILVAGTANTKKYDAYKTVKDYVDAHPKGKETALRILAMDYLSGHAKFVHPETGQLHASGNTPGKPTAEKPTAEKPATEKPTAEKPATIGDQERVDRILKNAEVIPAENNWLHPTQTEGYSENRDEVRIKDLGLKMLLDAPEEVRNRSARGKKYSKTELQHIDLSKVHFTQPSVNVGKIRKLAKEYNPRPEDFTQDESGAVGKWGEAPQVSVYPDGTIVSGDHHRLVAAALRGDKTAVARVTTYADDGRGGYIAVKTKKTIKSPKPTGKED